MIQKTNLTLTTFLRQGASQNRSTSRTAMKRNCPTFQSSLHEKPRKKHGSQLQCHPKPQVLHNQVPGKPADEAREVPEAQLVDEDQKPQPEEDAKSQTPLM